MLHNFREQNISHVSERVTLDADEIDDECPATVPLHNWEQSASKRHQHDNGLDNNHHHNRRHEYNRNTLHTPSTSERRHRYHSRSSLSTSPTHQTTTTNTSLSHYTPSSQRGRRATTQSSYSSYSFTPTSEESSEASSSLSPYSYSYSYSYSNMTSPVSTESFTSYETQSDYTPMHLSSHNGKFHSQSSSALMQPHTSTSSTSPLNSSSVPPTSHSTIRHPHRSHRHVDKHVKGKDKESRTQSSLSSRNNNKNKERKDTRVGRRTYHREVHPLPLSFINENRRIPSSRHHYQHNDNNKNNHNNNKYVHRTKFIHKSNTSPSWSTTSPTRTTRSNTTKESAAQYTRSRSALMQEELLHQLRARATSTPVNPPIPNVQLEKNHSTNIVDNNNINNNKNNNITSTRYVDTHEEDVRTQVTKPMMTTNVVQSQQQQQEEQQQRLQKTQIPLLPIQETIAGGKLANTSVKTPANISNSNINNINNTASKDNLAEIKTGGAVRVRIHQARNLFSNVSANGNNNGNSITNSTPTGTITSSTSVLSTFISIHTRNERSRTGVVHHSANPIYNDEFIFHVDKPSEDALVCTLVAFDGHKQHANKRTEQNVKQGKKRKIAECVLSLEYLLYKVERMVWMPLVHHPGTACAFTQGEVLISLYSEEYGLDTMPSLEDEDWFRHEAGLLLARYIPARLHQLDWLVGRFVMFGEVGIKRIEVLCTQSQQKERQSLDQRQSRTVYTNNVANSSSLINGVSFHITIKDVEGLVEHDGRPAHISSCYAIITSVNKNDNENNVNAEAVRHTSLLASELSLLQIPAARERPYFQKQTRTTRYHRRATINEKFECHVHNPHTDSVNVAIYHAARKLGEAEIGLINLKANTTRHVRLMLVHAAGTGDACVAGHVNVHVRSSHYTSAKCVSDSEESAIRERVQAFLWTRARDELHRLDPIVGNVIDDDAFMHGWVEVYGPEPIIHQMCVNVKWCANCLCSNNNNTTTGVVQKRDGGFVGNSNTNIGISNNWRFTQGRTSSSGSSSTRRNTLVPALPNIQIKCHVQINCGPLMYRTAASIYRNGEVVFHDPITIKVFDVEHDVLQLILIAEDDVVLPLRALDMQQILFGSDLRSGNMRNMNEIDDEEEIGRIEMALCTLSGPASTTRRVLPLVLAAGTLMACVQGEMGVELTPRDFGVALPTSSMTTETTNDASTANTKAVVVDKECNENEKKLFALLDMLLERSKPELLHRLPYLIETHVLYNPPSLSLSSQANTLITETTGGAQTNNELASVEQQHKDGGERGRSSINKAEINSLLANNSKVIREWCLPDVYPVINSGGSTINNNININNNNNTAVAPMIIRVLGLHDFHETGEVYVKCFLNGQDNMLMKTHYKKSAANVDFNIDDENESTTTLFDALRSTLTFIVVQRRTWRQGKELAKVEISLRNMVKGEWNTLWIPFFAITKGNDVSGRHGSRSNSNNSSSSSSFPFASSSTYSSSPLYMSSAALGTGANRTNFNGNSHNAASRSRSVFNVLYTSKPIKGNVMPDVLQAHIQRSHCAILPLGVLGISLQSLAFPETTVTIYRPVETVTTTATTTPRKSYQRSSANNSSNYNNTNNNATKTNASNEKTDVFQAVLYDVSTLLAKHRPQELSRVQPLISRCRSLKDAHGELRAWICKELAVETTVYLHIDAIEMQTNDGAVQEMSGGVAVEASFNSGADKQQTYKTIEFANDVIHQRIYYPPLRLDFANPLSSSASSASLPLPSNGNITTLSNTSLVQGTNIRSSRVRNDLKSNINSSSKHIHDYLVQAVDDNDANYLYYNNTISGSSHLLAPFPSLEIKLIGTRLNKELKALTAQRIKALQSTQKTEFTSSVNSVSSSKEKEQQAHKQKGKTRRGSENTLSAYVNNSSNTTTTTNNNTDTTNNVENTKSAFDSNLLLSSPCYSGEIGKVHLSLRALLTSNLYSLGERVCVPVIRPYPAASNKPAEVIASVTFHISLPMFEKLPPWLKLSSRNVLQNIIPDAIKYYKQRIEAYLRDTSVSSLTNFHHVFFERDVAQGIWPVSLPAWLDTLERTHGATIANDPVPRPVLPMALVNEAKQIQQQQLEQRNELVNSSTTTNTNISNSSSKKTVKINQSSISNSGNINNTSSINSRTSHINLTWADRTKAEAGNRTTINCQMETTNNNAIINNSHSNSVNAMESMELNS